MDGGGGRSEPGAVDGADDGLVHVDGDLGEGLLGFVAGGSEVSVGLVEALEGGSLVETVEGDGLGGRDVADGARMDGEDARADKELLRLAAA